VDRKITHRTKLLYGVGAFGYGSIGQTISSFLMFFGTGILGIPGTLMGLAVGISTVWDATTDPFVGHWSDNTRSRTFGKRHGWILFAGVFVAVINIILWSIPVGISTAGKFWLLLVILLIMETFNTCYSTPYGALGLDLSQNYNDRTAVQNYKTAFSFLSLLVPSVLMMFLLKDARSVTGYISIAGVTSSLCIICACICFAGTYRHRTMASGVAGSPAETRKPRVACAHPRPSGVRVSAGEPATPLATEDRRGIFEEFFGVIRQKNVGRLIAGYAISLSAGAFLTSLGLHVFTYTFHFSTTQIPIIMMCLIAGIIAGQPFWFCVSRRTDKITALVSALAMLVVCMMVFACVLPFRNMVPHGSTLAFVCVLIAACGIGTGCLYSLPISMYADCIAVRKQETGVDNTGKSAGFLTFCTKISNAVILFVIGLSLDIIGFNGRHATQSMNVQNWLGWLLICGVTIASTVAMLVYSKYSYTKRDFE
jgi:Na+/melibiose symporter-like transporter